MNNSEKYYNKHKFCPKCGSDNFTQTCKGFLSPSSECPDTNKVLCECGWVGIIHQLKGKKCLNPELAQ